MLLEDSRWVRDRLRWVADLSDGRTVYMDDGRTDVLPRSAWLRLREYCRTTGARIDRLRLQFRDNVVWLPAGHDGYFFCRTAFGVYGDDQTHEGFVAGVLIGTTVYTRRYRAPDLYPLDVGERPLDPDGECLIASIPIGLT